MSSKVENKKTWQRYMSLEPIKRLDNEGRELLGKTLYSTEKRDGCFYADTQVLLSDYTTLTIKEIVENKINADVFSVNKNGKVEIKKIIGFSKSKESSKFIKVKTKDGLVLLVTPDHPICVRLNPQLLFKKAGKLTNKYEYVYVLGKFCNSIQKQVLFGTLLGDASISFTSGINISHSEKQIEYIEKLKHLFSKFPILNDQQISGFGSNMFRIRISLRKQGFSVDTMKEILEFCKHDKKKKITLDWLNEITPLSLAIWYMDDGSIKYNNGRNPIIELSTYGFLKEELEHLRMMLLWKFNIYSRTTQDGRIVIYTESEADKFFSLVAPYTLKSIRYKLPEKYKECVLLEWWLDNIPEFSLRSTRIISVEESNVMGYRYNIEVEDNNTFFAGYTLVHNSNVSLWLDETDTPHISSHNLEVAEDSIQNKFKQTPEYPKAVDLLMDERHTWHTECITYGELIYDGVSPTRIERKKKNPHWVLFDIYDLTNHTYMDYTLVYMKGYHFHIPVVKLLDTFIPLSLEELYAKVEEQLKWCRRHNREGVVIKNYADQLFIKEKVDLPKKPKLEKPQKSDIIYPPMTQERIDRAIQHAIDIVGIDNWKNVKIAMPIVAQQISTEASEHFFNVPRNFYQIYLDSLVNDKYKTL